LGEAVVKRIRDSGGEATFIRADLSREDEVKNLTEAATRAYGGIDILVNNAAATDSIGTGSKDKRCSDLLTEDLDYILKVGLYGVFWGTKYALPSMIARGGGSIINISSGAALLASQDLTAYTFTKGGLNAFTRSVAVDYGRQGIRCNCIVVGYVRDGGLDNAVFDDPNTGEILRGMTMIGKIGEPRHVANLVAFLASDEAEYITGTNIPCDGGMNAKLAVPQGIHHGAQSID
jgi:NAD(P)-dependent dehydrogenase (short-subunit alcohol dehydrogenase family)